MMEGLIIFCYTKFFRRQRKALCCFLPSIFVWNGQAYCLFGTMVVKSSSSMSLWQRLFGVTDQTHEAITSLCTLSLSSSPPSIAMVAQDTRKRYMVDPESQTPTNNDDDGNHNQKKKQKKVTFILPEDEDVRQEGGDEDHNPRLNYLTKQEKSSTWYSIAELKAIKEENNQTIQWIINGCYDTGNEVIYCSRGMEYKTPIGKKMRRRRRKESWRQTLNYQENQKFWGHPVCPNKIRDIYTKHTQHSTHLAVLAAKIDQQHAVATTSSRMKKLLTGIATNPKTNTAATTPSAMVKTTHLIPAAAA